MTQQSTAFSRIVAGTMTWGSWGRKFDRSQMQQLLQDCLDLGITTFDHADIYGDYENEAQFGQAYKHSGIGRDELQLVTKCGIQMLGDARPNRVKHYDYRRDYIVSSAERSLKALQTDHIDLFLLHRPSPLLEPEEVAAAITHLQQRGMIRDFGLSNFSPSQVQLLERYLPVHANQVEFSLGHTHPMYDGTWDDCMAHHRLAMAWSPLGSYFNGESLAATRLEPLLHELGEKYQADASQLLLAWVLRHPARVYPVVGTTRKERLKASVQALEISLELQDWFLLLEAGSGSEVP